MVIVFLHSCLAQAQKTNDIDKVRKENISRYRKEVDSLEREIKIKKKQFTGVRESFRFSGGGWHTSQIGYDYVLDSTRKIRDAIVDLRRDSLLYAKMNDSIHDANNRRGKFNAQSGDLKARLSDMKMASERLSLFIDSMKRIVSSYSSGDVALSNTVSEQTAFPCSKVFDSLRKAHPFVKEMEVILEVQLRDELSAIRKTIEKEPYALAMHEVEDAEKRLIECLDRYGLKREDGLFAEHVFRIWNLKNYIHFMDMYREYVSRPYRGSDRKKLAEQRARILDFKSGACLSKNATDTLDKYYVRMNAYCKVTIEVMDNLSGVLKTHSKKKLIIPPFLDDPEKQYTYNYPHLVAILKDFTEEYNSNPTVVTVDKYKERLRLKYDKDCYSFMQ